LKYLKTNENKLFLSNLVFQIHKSFTTLELSFKASACFSLSLLG
jgi:hypothetical protein